MALHERQIKGLVNPADRLIGLLSVGFETDARLLVQCVCVHLCPVADCKQGKHMSTLSGFTDQADMTRDERAERELVPPLPVLLLRAVSNNTHLVCSMLSLKLTVNLTLLLTRQNKIQRRDDQSRYH